MTRERLLRMVVRALNMCNDEVTEGGRDGGAHWWDYCTQTILITLLHSDVGLCQSIQAV